MSQLPLPVAEPTGKDSDQEVREDDHVVGGRCRRGYPEVTHRRVRDMVAGLARKEVPQQMETPRGNKPPR